jgi:elongation factor P--beta-lysine ligase
MRSGSLAASMDHGRKARRTRRESVKRSAVIIRQLRKFSDFSRRNCLEVETPLLRHYGAAHSPA